MSVPGGMDQMDQKVDRWLYLSLVDQFLAGELPFAPFREAVLGLRDREREWVEALTSSWPEPYHHQLRLAARERRISPAEYGRRWARLFGYGENRPLYELAYGVEAACRFCSPDPADYADGAAVPEDAEAELRAWVGDLRRQYTEARPDQADPLYGPGS